MTQFDTTSNLSPYDTFTREAWANLRAATPLTLSETDLDKLRGLTTYVSLDEVAKIYLPLSRLLGLFVTASQQLYQVTDNFLGHTSAKVPYVIGIAGSVAAGKSTTARILQALLQRWPSHPRVDLVTTDGFLHPNELLQERNLMHRKGFPESYSQRRLIKFIMDVKSGQPLVHAPKYSHLSYNVIPDEYQIVDRPDILIFEGLNILQPSEVVAKLPAIFLSDFFDFSIYVDASEENLKRWYLQRFMHLRETAFQNPNSFFNKYSQLSGDEVVETASRIWDTINAINLVENIQPTRERASLILQKGDDHLVERIFLRKL